MSLQEAVEADSFSTCLLSKIGNGEFAMQLQQPRGLLVRGFILPVGKIQRPREPSEDSAGQSATSQLMDTLKTVAEILKLAAKSNWVEVLKVGCYIAQVASLNCQNILARLIYSEIS